MSILLRDAGTEIEMPAEFVGKGADPNTLGPASHPLWTSTLWAKIKTTAHNHPMLTALVVISGVLGGYKLGKTIARKR